MSNTVLSGVEEFIPHFAPGHHGQIGTFHIEPNWEISINLILGNLLCYVQDGLFLAIVEFSVDDKDGMDDPTGSVALEMGYFLDGIPHPEYFAGLTAINVAEMYRKGIFVSLGQVAKAAQLWRVVDMRADRDGRDYYVAMTPTTGVSFLRQPYVFTEDKALSSLLDYDELHTLVTSPPIGPTLWYVDHVLKPEERMSWDEFYASGLRLMIENTSTTVVDD